MVRPRGELNLANFSRRPSLLEFQCNVNLYTTTPFLERTYGLDHEETNGEIGEVLLFVELNLDGAVVLRPPLRPVLMALRPGPLHEPRHHDDRVGPGVHHHPPEIVECLRQRCLEETSLGAPFRS